MIINFSLTLPNKSVTNYAKDICIMGRFNK